jgi:hypothetical protein
MSTYAAPAPVAAPGTLVDEVLPRYDARTVQEIPVDAAPAVAYSALWQADLLGSPVTRGLLAIGRVPEVIAARLGREAAPDGDRHWTLADATAPGSPWILVAERPGEEVVLGLLWTPPAGGTTCAPEDFAGFSAPGVAKVTWSFAVVPYGRGSLLVTETRTAATDDCARRRFRAVWPVVKPFAGLTRAGVLRSIARHAAGVQSVDAPGVG